MRNMLIATVLVVGTFGCGTHRKYYKFNDSMAVAQIHGLNPTSRDYPYCDDIYYTKMVAETGLIHEVVSCWAYDKNHLVAVVIADTPQNSADTKIVNFSTEDVRGHISLTNSKAVLEEYAYRLLILGRIEFNKAKNEAYR